MRTDSLQEFIKLRRQLTEEKGTIEKRLRQINEALGDLDGGTRSAAAPAASSSADRPVPAKRGKGGKRQMSPEARERIADAQRKRWAAARKEKGGSEASANSSTTPSGKPKRKMSAAGRRAIAEAAKRRWAAARASGQNKL